MNFRICCDLMNGMSFCGSNSKDLSVNFAFLLGQAVCPSKTDSFQFELYGLVLTACASRCHWFSLAVLYASAKSQS